MASPRIFIVLVASVIIAPNLAMSFRVMNLPMSYADSPRPRCPPVPAYARCKLGCSWFCDICLRRFAITLGQIHSTTVRHQADTCQSGITLERMTLEYVDETTSAWGAASTSTFEPLAPSTHNILGGEDGASIVHAPTGTGFSVGNGNADGPASGVEQVTRFRTFTLVCARTAVTDQGARVAEALAPGLLVVLEERSAVAGLHLAM